ncbi:MAG TPA: helix-turn-helix domain-containing protein [Rubrivivax sp.]
MPLLHPAPRPGAGLQPGDATLQPLPDAARRTAIVQSHERSAALGLQANDTPELSPGPPSHLAEARARHRRLYEQAAPVMEMLFEQIVFTRSIVVLADSGGTILHAVGDDGFLERAQQVALAPGVNWSEATKGTNAIGTALFNEAPTLVHSGEHYVRANHFLTCSAAPIFDHAGQLLGVLDVTGDRRSYHPHTLAMVGMSARVIENQWFEDRFRHGLRLHFHPRAERLGTVREGMIALGPDGSIVGANRSALELLGLSSARLRGLGLQAVLGCDVPALADHSRRRGDEPIELHLGEGDGAGSPVFGRVVFNTPLVWPTSGWRAHPAPASTPVGKPSPPQATLQGLEMQAIREAVDHAGGNLSLAARQLGIGRTTLYRKLRGRAND